MLLTHRYCDMNYLNFIFTHNRAEKALFKIAVLNVQKNNLG